MLDRRIVYFGSSIYSITRGQTRHDIEECFKKGIVGSECLAELFSFL
nr:unnamed protein product [Digitaria exilis]